MELEIRNLNTLLIEKNKTISKLEEIVKVEQEEKIDIINELEKYRKETEEQREVWAEETLKLRKELDNINEIVKSSQKGAEENMKMRFEQEKMLILNEQDSDKQAYQKLLEEYHSLEQHCENLEAQLNAQNLKNTHARNVSDISSISMIDENMLSITELPEDHGYGSVRSTSSTTTNRKLDNIDWKYEGNYVFIYY